MNDKEVYGNKGKNLKFIDSLGFPVPEFFIIKSDEIPDKDRIRELLKALNADYVSVRSSPNYSLPGILETTLNIKGDNVDLIYIIAKEIMSSVTSK